MYASSETMQVSSVRHSSENDRQLKKISLQAVIKKTLADVFLFPDILFIRILTNDTITFIISLKIYFKEVLQMEKFVPFEKLSKKRQKELNKTKRNTWGMINPVTRREKNPKAYDRNKLRSGKFETEFIFFAENIIIKKFFTSARKYIFLIVI